MAYANAVKFLPKFFTMSVNIDLLTMSEVAVILKLSKRTVHRLTVKKIIPGFKVGGQWRYQQATLEKYVEQQEEKAAL